jgi:hypothetical protein
VQKTFLAGASATLAEHCCSQQPTRLGLSEKALRIFLAWLISGDLDEVANCQMSLAQAWDFGEQYGIPQFQDDVMRQLVPCLGDEEVDQSAVVEAYAVEERDTMLKCAFITQLAGDMRRGGIRAWSRATFAINHLGRAARLLFGSHRCYA